jgi:flagellar motor component MotA
MTYPTTHQAFHPPPVAPRDRFSGFATAFLTLGIVGTVFSVVPYLDVLTMRLIGNSA